jgi:hypothetical protein
MPLEILGAAGCLMRTQVIALMFAFAGMAAAQTRPTVVVELFTSEGCSSCPPADELLARLDSNLAPNPAGSGRGRGLASSVELIALGEHVDYWDQLGWKDRFSSPLFSSRQEEYGRAFKLGSIYTPQAVIDGEYEVLGSDRRAIQDAIRKAASQPRAEVAISRASSDTVAFRIAKLPPGSHESDILLAVTESRIESPVWGGENSGRTLRHAAVVHTLNSLGRLDPKYPGEYSAQARLSLRPEWNRNNLKLVLFVQDRTTRRILGAAALKP